jgi:undecaprenyl-diphosphatase
MEWFQKILDYDIQAFLFLNGFHSDFWDTVMLMVTRKETWLPLYLVILFFFIKDYKSKSLLIILFLVLTIVSSDQISVLIKESVQRLRPVYNPAIEDLVHNVLRKGGKHGFVSSHAANSFAIFVFTSRIFKNRRYGWLMFFWALLLCYSRIYSGVHYPLDLLGGGILGWLLGEIFYKIMMFFENHFFIARFPKIEKTMLAHQQAGTILLVFSVLSATVLIMTSILHYYNYL